MKCTLVFEDCLEGHHLEYIHHLYCAAMQYPNEYYIFFLPESFSTVSNEFDWPPVDNIELRFLPLDKYLNQKQILRGVYERAKVLSKLIKELKPTHVFLVAFMRFIPFIYLFKTYNAKISGIVYNIYLYRWKNSNPLTRLLDITKFYLMTKSKKIDRVFILNDKVCTRRLNKLYSTNKFRFLPDPISTTLFSANFKDLRNELGISLHKTIYLHFGAMAERKGTLTVLESIRLLPVESYPKLCFIFAGKVNEDIFDSFNNLVNELKEKVQIIVINRFCEYSYFCSLCITSDYIIIPYKHSNQSSGILGYAAFFKKPVIGPGTGTMGRIIKAYKLGMILNEITSNTLAKAMQVHEKNTSVTCQNEYIKANTIDLFTKTILTNYQCR